MSKWGNLKAVNYYDHRNNDCNLMVLNRNEILFVPQLDTNLPWDEDAETSKTVAVWKYNIKQNEWMKWIEIAKKYARAGFWTGHTSSLDSQNMILYIFSKHEDVIKIDLNTKEITKSDGQYG